MKNLAQKMGMTSWLAFAGFGYFCVFYIIGPTFKEIVGLIVVDTISLGIVITFESLFWAKLFPQFSLFYPEPNTEKIQALPLQEKVQLVREGFMKLPSFMAKYCVWSSFIKVTPSLIYIYMVWDVGWTAPKGSFFLLFCILMMFSFFYCCVFIECHLFLSKSLKQFHTRYDWSEVFLAVSSSKLKPDFSIREIEHSQNLARILMISALSGLTWIVVTQSNHSDVYKIARDVLFLNIGAFVLNARLEYLFRSFFTLGLKSIATTLANIHPSHYSYIPLHSHPLLAAFESAFNQLVLRLRGYEKELVHQIFSRLEKRRYEALGESMAIVAHDLSGPLQAIVYCSSQLSSATPLDPNENKRYLDQILLNSKRSVELVSSIKGAFKSPSEEHKGVKLSHAISEATQLARIQFLHRGIKRPSIQVDERLAQFIVKIPQLELSHVLVNLVSNSLHNLLIHQVPFPEIHFDFNSKTQQHVQFSISDNGTGLTPEAFDALTGYGNLAHQRDLASKGLGLKLIRRLIEFSNGKIQVSRTPLLGGTTIQILLPLLEEELSREEIPAVPDLPLSNGVNSTIEGNA